MASTSPTQLSLLEARARGWTAAVTEHWNPHAKIRQDLFGVIDILALGPGQIIGIQATSDSHVAERVKKIEAHANTPALLASGITLLVWGWKKTKGRWTLREVDCDPNAPAE